MFFLRDDFQEIKSIYTGITCRTNDVTFSPVCIEIDQSPNYTICAVETYQD